MPAMPSRQSVAVAARRSSPSVDTPREASLSFPPLDRPVERGRSAEPTVDTPARDRAPDARPRRRRPRLVVEGPRPAVAASSLASTGGPLGAMPDYPVQISKVQAPPLRDETLARDRLLDWLSVKIHRRVVLVVAEAGYGKTTLLADFTRRTRIRVLWFRLDRGDRDWVGFIAYLVAAVRIHVPDFGQATSALLRETATTAPPMDTVLDTFLRELTALPNDPSALVFDDFHLVDDSPDVRHILRELLTRGPERMSFVFATRSEPPIRLARLRALGEVAELGTDDLRFDAAETERLFRETYEMRLEPAMLAELNRRTEGWAASLQLVRAALHDRDPGQVRSFISSLSGAEGHLYEYLAEEVIGELPRDLQQFLMRTSLLETVDLTLGPVAADVDEETARSLIEAGERHGLFGKGGPRSRHVVRAHPLVRDFLQARLIRAVGEHGAREIHLRVARAAEVTNWRVSTRHYLAGGQPQAAKRVLEEALEIIFATGAYDAAQDLATALASDSLSATVELLIRSRVAQQRGALEEGRALAEEAWAQDPGSSAALLNLVTARSLAGDVPAALEANRILEDSTHTELAEIGRAFQRTMEASVAGPLDVAVKDILQISARHRDRGRLHYLGVSALNLALIELARGRWEEGIASADEAIASLSKTSAGVELVSARLARAHLLGYRGDMEGARQELKAAEGVAGPGQAQEFASEVAMLEGFLGDAERAWPLLDQVSESFDESVDSGEQGIYARALLHLRRGDLAAAVRDIGRLQFGVPRTAIAFEARRHLMAGAVLQLDQHPESLAAIGRGVELARRQKAQLWVRYGELLMALHGTASAVAGEIMRAASSHPVVLSMAAEPLLSRLADLSDESFEAVRLEATARPDRWRTSIRRSLPTENARVRRFAARLLAAIGERRDVPRLREVGQAFRDRSLHQVAYELARRLADKVLVEDMGKVRVRIGARVVEGPEMRRKVLALLCLLVSRARFAATREEVVDSLWPENDPTSALNSLNQTVYFLRRVFEPEYLDATSPGYVGQDGETVWLDAGLVDAVSHKCLEIIRSMPTEPSTEGALLLAEQYRGHFALDFAYEEWASQYRDSLHAGYLRVMEHAIKLDLRTGHVGRGIFLAERAAEVDPEAEEIQVSLIRLYRMSGAHAAAAEQYGHYAQALRELGVEPVPISDM